LFAKGRAQTLPIQRLGVSLREQAPSHGRTRLSTDCDLRCFLRSTGLTRSVRSPPKPWGGACSRRGEYRRCLSSGWKSVFASKLPPTVERGCRHNAIRVLRSALLFAIYRAYAVDPITAKTVGGSLHARGRVQPLPIQRLEVSLREQAPSHGRTWCRLIAIRVAFCDLPGLCVRSDHRKTVGGGLLAKGRVQTLPICGWKSVFASKLPPTVERDCRQIAICFAFCDLPGLHVRSDHRQPWEGACSRRGRNYRHDSTV
jgi:hypothetical protein